MSQPMKALSLWQPWASLMAIGAKKIETRSWPTPYRGLVAIHAAQKWDNELSSLCYEDPFFKALKLTPEWQNRSKSIPWGGASGLPRGGFVAVGKLRHCLSTTRDAKFIPSEKSDEYWFGDYSEGRFMWVFDEIWKLSSPVYATGQRRLWTPDEREKDVIITMLPEEVRASEFGEL